MEVSIIIFPWLTHHCVLSIWKIDFFSSSVSLVHKSRWAETIQHRRSTLRLDLDVISWSRRRWYTKGRLCRHGEGETLRNLWPANRQCRIKNNHRLSSFPPLGCLFNSTLFPSVLACCLALLLSVEEVILQSFYLGFQEKCQLLH